jgi:hypothetical protein
MSQKSKPISYWDLVDTIMSDGVCCPDGERVSCVCRASVICKTHGSICVGSHD